MSCIKVPQVTCIGDRVERSAEATSNLIACLVCALLALISACSSDGAPTAGGQGREVHAQETATSVQPSASGDATRLLWPVGDGISSFVTQSSANSEQVYPCGSGVNGRHILRDKDGDNEDYLHSIDIVARSRNAPENAEEGRGTAITAVADGRVVAINMSQNECDRPFGAGNYVILEHQQVLVDGKPLRSAYMHLNSTYAAERASDCGINPRPTHQEDFRAPELGDIVRAGEKLGELGNTGNSTGPHLHFQFALDCILQPASEVYCPAIAVLDVNPHGFSDIRVARDKSCGDSEVVATGTPNSQPNEVSYLSDGSYVTTTSPSYPTQSISASVGGP